MRTASSPAPASVAPTGSPLARPIAFWPSALAAGCYAFIALLSIAPEVRAQGGDSTALLFLGVCALLVLATPLRRYFLPDDERLEPTARNASTFALLCAMSVLFPLARRYAPLEGFALRVGGLEEPFPISIAAVIAIVGALLSLGPTWRVCSGVVRASALALAIVGVLGVGSFFLLGRYYTVGATEQVDPTPLVHLLMQGVEWGALVLLCHAASAHASARRLLLFALPVLLLVVWARQQTLAPLRDDE